MMFWEEDTPSRTPRIPDDVVDLRFAIAAESIPIDHALALASALRHQFPELMEIKGLAIHPIHVAGSQNGWERPTLESRQPLLLSKRTKLVIRTPKIAVETLSERLTGATLPLPTGPLRLGSAHSALLSSATTLFTRQLVVDEPSWTELEFLNQTSRVLQSMGIRMRKAICGKSQLIEGQNGFLATRSLMLADLDARESLLLQERGLGSHPLLGCGIFIPHKGIDAVSSNPTPE